jgi:hypothetical protein
MSETDAERVIRIANEILRGDVDLITGRRQLALALGRAGLEQEADALTIWEVDSDSDNMPVGSVRELWDPAALVEQDARREAYVARARDDVLTACRNLVRKLSLSGDGA